MNARLGRLIHYLVIKKFMHIIFKYNAEFINCYFQTEVEPLVGAGNERKYIVDGVMRNCLC